MPKNKKTRALCLLSGGLDSLLAVCVLKNQGVEVTGITFVTPFFGATNAKRSAQQLGIELIVVDITDEHLEMIKNPRHGYGKGMNPCIDCHAMMIKKAGEILKRDGFDLIATGEVLGERPMSQNLQALDTVARDSGFADFVLRPLSAKLLKPTKLEQDGLIDREKLLDLQGRSRKPQMELAQKFGIKNYMQPAGGCLLTDPNFSARLSALLEENPSATADDIQLLKLGRHFRLPSGARAIVGRNFNDNEKIAAEMKHGRALMSPSVAPGPTVLLVNGYGEDDVKFAAELCASYSDHNGLDIEIEWETPEGKNKLKANPKSRSWFSAIKI